MGDHLVDIMEWSWAAGFYDGEGGAYARSCRPQVAINHVDRRPLARFLAAVGVGSLRGPYHHKNPNHNAYYTYRAYGANACAVMQVLLPMLSEPKREQWADVLNNIH